jgi:sec-independent protein translocase protein TatA
MNLAIPGLSTLGAPELLLIIFVLVLLFGAKKLPEMARGSGRALRIFKAEIKGLSDDDEDKPTGATRAETTTTTSTSTTPSGASAIEQRPSAQPTPPALPVEDTARREP